MLDSATVTNISDFLVSKVTDEVKKVSINLKLGDLHGFEQSLQILMREAYNFICKEVLPEVAEGLKEELKEASLSAGNRKIKSRDTIVRIATGELVRVPSLYIGKPIKGMKKSRHLINNYWSLIKGNSPLLYDQIGYCSALGPSYEVGHQTLKKFGVNVCLSSVRDINNNLANHCSDFGEEHLIVEQGETVKGKRVVLSIDGGRTRLREYSGQRNKKGELTYDTAWREPKLFVIDILDKNGKVDRRKLPLYGVRFSEEDCFELLSRYLKKLNIEQAKEVQIIADGAPWIWKHTKPLLEKLGVPSIKITETLDVYHATKYVNDLVENMPKRIDKTERNNYLKVFKELLWKGESKIIVDTCRSIYKKPNDLVRRYINYLDKHEGKMQYADLQSNKLMCGSGIVESAIRRIINLRFKNSGTFWKKSIVEKLYFFRGALLAGRWNTLIHNITHTQ